MFPICTRGDFTQSKPQPWTIREPLDPDHPAARVFQGIYGGADSWEAVIKVLGALAEDATQGANVEIWHGEKKVSTWKIRLTIECYESTRSGAYADPNNPYDPDKPEPAAEENP